MSITKKLANQLGIIKQYKIEDGSLITRLNSKQIFSYIIVIDFESTCWKEYRGLQEIIEFPAVLLNTQTGNIESEFHHYVMPIENPILSDFCKEFTGISQNDVEQGIPINTCLFLFTKWLNELATKYKIIFPVVETNFSKDKNPCTFLTWSDWDLGVCLDNECKRKRIQKPTEMNSWIDLRITYKSYYGKKPNGLNGALTDLGLKFDGRQHSGIDDTRNTAKLAYSLIKDGCVLTTTKHSKFENTLKPVIKNPFKKVEDENIISGSCKNESNSISNISHNASNSKTNIYKNSSNASSNISITKQLIRNPFGRIENKTVSFNKTNLKNNSVISLKSNTSSEYIMKTPQNKIEKLPYATKSMQKTPPLCNCGKRSKRKVTTNPGPNSGRAFYCCSKTGRCSFFLWENDNQKTFNNESISLYSINNSASPDLKSTINRSNNSITEILKPALVFNASTRTKSFTSNKSDTLLINPFKI